jgi:hypothetical protein
VSVALVASVLACPVCFTDLGQQVRAEILGPDLLFNLGVALLPFAVLACAVATIDRLPFLAPPRERATAAPHATGHTQEQAPWTADH